jgi:dTDP-4-dehydrorhamnose 3,5-epimerase-like enzyme
MRQTNPFEIFPFYTEDSRGKLTKLSVISDRSVFPLGVLDEYIAYSSMGVFRGFHRQLSPDGGNKVFFALKGKIELFTLRAEQVERGEYLPIKWVVEENGTAVVVPEGHFTGYLVLSKEAIIQVKASYPYVPVSQVVIPPRLVWGLEATDTWILSPQDRGNTSESI